MMLILLRGLEIASVLPAEQCALLLDQDDGSILFSITGADGLQESVPDTFDERLGCRMPLFNAQ